MVFIFIFSKALQKLEWHQSTPLHSTVFFVSPRLQVCVLCFAAAVREAKAIVNEDTVEASTLCRSVQAGHQRNVEAAEQRGTAAGRKGAEGPGQ